MNKILINFAHPAKSRSKINKALRGAVENLEGITVNDLYSNYPDFLIDVEREQALCVSNDIIIFQQPFYWFSTPAIVKEWFDLVLGHGWAYGSRGNALQGKTFLLAITAGGGDGTYRRGGSNRFTINELLSPFEAMANLCKMTWLPPFTVLGIHRGLPLADISLHAENYRQCIIALRDGTLEIEKAQHMQYLNSDLAAVIRRS